MNFKFRFFNIFSLIIVVFQFTPLTLAFSGHEHIQAVHILDPGISEFKYYNSWNSDQWIQWVRNRFIKDEEERRNTTNNDSDHDEGPLIGRWVNIIVITSMEDMQSSFSALSKKAYPDSDSGTDMEQFYWSDVPFSVFVVVRQRKAAVQLTSLEMTNNEEDDENKNANGINNNGESDKQSPIIEPQYNVFNCERKKMYINAKCDPETFQPISMQNFFPKQVKNPKKTLRIPLVVCSKVSQVRGLLDEIKFQLGN